jgi:alpha-beta hydrolase superfamily lysophospholipase
VLLRTRTPEGERFMTDTEHGRGDAPVQAEYLVIGDENARIDGVLRQAAGGRSSTVLIQTHPRARSEENLTGWPCPELPARGFDTFAYNNRVTNSTAGTEVVTEWEELALDVAAAVTEMRKRGYRSVILYGYSAGGPLVSYYQNVAENGNAVFRGGDTLSGFTGFERGGRELRLPPADGIVVQNSTTGTGYSFLTRLDGAVVDESTGERDPELDLFEPSNGYDPATGAASYSRAFLRRYFAAQCLRMDRLIASAQERLEASLAGRGRFRDDDLMVIPGIRAEPASVDLALAAQTSEPRPLHPSGATTVVRSSRRVVPNYALRNRRFRDGGTVHTYRSFLSYRAVIADPASHDPDAVTPETAGVRLESTNSTTPGNIAGISVPLLITSGTADTQVHIPHAELMFNAATRTRDKEIAFIEGAEHDMTPVRPESGDTRGTHLQVVSEWLEARFGPAAR